MPNRCCFVPNCKAEYLGSNHVVKQFYSLHPKMKLSSNNGSRTFLATMQILKLHQEYAQVISKKLSLSKAGCLKRRREKKFSLLRTIEVLNKEPPQEFFPGFHFSFSNLIKLVSSCYINFSLYNIGCPSYLNKPKSAKRKLPKGRQTANKRNPMDCDQVDDLRE